MLDIYTLTLKTAMQRDVSKRVFSKIPAELKSKESLSSLPALAPSNWPIFQWTQGNCTILIDSNLQPK